MMNATFQQTTGDTDNKFDKNFDVNIKNRSGTVNHGCLTPDRSITSIDIQRHTSNGNGSNTSSLTMVTHDIRQSQNKSLSDVKAGLVLENDSKEVLSVSGSARNGIRLRLSAIQERPEFGGKFSSAPSDFI